jgi:ribosomal protein L6P/L9E
MIQLEIREVEFKTQGLAQGLGKTRSNSLVGAQAKGPGGSQLRRSQKIKQCIIHYNGNYQGCTLKYQKSLFVDYKTNILLEKDSINNYTIKVDTTDKRIKGLLESKLNMLIKGLLSNHKKAMVLNGVGYWIKFNKNLNSQEIKSLDKSSNMSKDESVCVEMNIGYKNSIKKEIPKDIIVYIGNETLNKSIHTSTPGLTSSNLKGKIQPNELVCESHDLDKLTNWMNSIKQLKPSYKDKYKQKGWSDVYSWKDK